MRSLADEFEESTNSVRVELNRFESAGMLHSDSEGNKKVFRVNKSFPLFSEVRAIILKQTGLNKIIEGVIHNLGDVHEVYLTGDLAQGKASHVISLLIVGDPDRTYLSNLVTKAEGIVDKKIQYLIYSRIEFELLSLDPTKALLLWNE